MPSEQCQLPSQFWIVAFLFVTNAINDGGNALCTAKFLREHEGIYFTICQKYSPPKQKKQTPRCDAMYETKETISIIDDTDPLSPIYSSIPLINPHHLRNPPHPLHHHRPSSAAHREPARRHQSCLLRLARPTRFKIISNDTDIDFTAIYYLFHDRPEK